MIIMNARERAANIMECILNWGQMRVPSLIRRAGMWNVKEERESNACNMRLSGVVTDASNAKSDLTNVNLIKKWRRQVNPSIL
jgi:hypothetical protein